MNSIKNTWHRYAYKNLTIFAISILVGVLLLRTSILTETVFRLGNIGYIGAFIGGMLFISTFTVTIGTALLLILAESLHPVEIGIIAGVGAVIGDLTIFHYIRDKGFVSENVQYPKYYTVNLVIIGTFRYPIPRA